MMKSSLRAKRRDLEAWLRKERIQAWSMADWRTKYEDPLQIYQAWSCLQMHWSCALAIKPCCAFQNSLHGPCLHTHSRARPQTLLLLPFARSYLWEDLVEFYVLIWCIFMCWFGAYLCADLVQIYVQIWHIFMFRFGLNLYADLVQIYVPI